jgi:hypothetical protein
MRSILYFIGVKLDARLNLDLTRGRNKSIVTTAIIHPRQEVRKGLSSFRNLLTLFYCHCEERSDEAILMVSMRMEIATPRQVGARNDTEDYYPMP